MRTAPSIVCCALLLAACGGEAATPTRDGETLIAREGSTLLALDIGSGDVRRTPAGAHDLDWDAVYAARPGTSTTVITATDPATGRTLRTSEIDGQWSIPIAAGSTPEGAVSGDGAWLVLAGPSGERESHFALLSTALDMPPSRFSLPDRFEFDALSPDGKAIFLSQIQSSGRYAVRAFDISEGRLRPEVVVDKTSSLGTIMQGVPVARAVDPTGSPVHTLYRGGPEGAFVHSLDTADGSALCILIPRSRKAGPRWQLRLDAERSSLHALNVDLGAHYVIDPRDGAVQDAPEGTRVPGSALEDYALADDGAVLAGGRRVGKLAGGAELLAVRSG